MSHLVTFDSPQTLTLVAKQEISDLESVKILQWIESTTDIYDTDDEGEVILTDGKPTKVDYTYTIHVYIEGSRVPLKNLLGSDQTRLKEILDGSDTAVSKKATVVKEAIESGDYDK